MAEPANSLSLADLQQDIAGSIPVDLIKAWLATDRSEQAHEAVLAPYKRVGTIVCSDAAGLSKLSTTRSLIEVMKLVSEPKEIIHAHAKAIGGQAVGVWVADNTQVFYPSSIPVNEIVTQMIAAQRAIENVLVNVGIGIHTGTAYEIGGGLYGAEADTIEDFTENESEACEIIVSDTVKSQLPGELADRLTAKHNMYALDYTNLRIEHKTSDESLYPAPFDRAFLESLIELDLNDQAALQILHQERVQTTTIILCRLFHTTKPLLLDTLVQNVAANRVIHEACKNSPATLIKSNGALAIFACADKQQAVQFAQLLGQTLVANGYICNLGVAAGEVLLFELSEDAKDLAGGPVNVASKLAEDTHERQVIFCDDSVAEAARNLGITEAHTLVKSGVSLQALKQSL